MWVRLISVLVVLLIFAPAQAFALSGTVLLGFGEGYVSGAGKTLTHHGIDLAIASGAQALSPVSGQVRFAGRVPGTGGGSVLAVTVDSDAGSVTMLPLDALAVKAGDSVCVGSSVGELAAEGDASSGETHLHVGLKHGELYLDPTSLLEAVPAPDQGGQERKQPASSAQVGVTQADPQTHLGPAVASVTAAGPAATVPRASRVPRTAAAPAVAYAAPRMAPGEQALGIGVSLAPGSDTAGAPVAPGAGHAPTIVTHAQQKASGRAAVTDVHPSSVPNTLLVRTATGIAAGAILLVALVFTARRTVARRVATRPRMSDRFGIFVAAPVNR